MLTRIRKRDGRDVSFDPNKITEAIYKAAQSVGGSDREMAMELTLDVLRLLKQKYNGQVCGVEEVQDMVEKVLIERGQQEGNVRPGIDPMQINISIAALGFFYISNRYTLATVYDCNLLSEKALKERLNVMKETISSWIKP